MLDDGVYKLTRERATGLKCNDDGDGEDRIDHDDNGFVDLYIHCLVYNHQWR